MAEEQQVVIVGAGEFGCSTATAMLKSGRYIVTMLDKAHQLPAMDAASSDLNKVVRYDYDDVVYAQLALEAIHEWRQPRWAGVYHEFVATHIASGLVILGTENQEEQGAFARASLAMVEKLDMPLTKLNNRTDVQKALTRDGTSDIQIGETQSTGYLNKVAGWASARSALISLLEEAVALGATVVTNSPLERVERNAQGEATAVIAGGRRYEADIVLVAAGAWTPTIPALEGILPAQMLIPSGQPVCTMQLTAEMAERYKNIPVNMQFTGQGVYFFPPDEKNVLKIAIHGSGYISDCLHTTSNTATATYLSDRGLAWVTSEDVVTMRTAIRAVYPELASQPINCTRMCYYCDTADSDFLIDFSPQCRNMLFAAGAGHAFKFLPIIGGLVLQRIEKTINPLLWEKWSMHRERNRHSSERPGTGRKRFDLGALASMTSKSILGETTSGFKE